MPTKHVLASFNLLVLHFRAARRKCWYYESKFNVQQLPHVELAQKNNNPSRLCINTNSATLNAGHLQFRMLSNSYSNSRWVSKSNRYNRKKGSEDLVGHDGRVQWRV